MTTTTMITSDRAAVICTHIDSGVLKYGASNNTCVATRRMSQRYEQRILRTTCHLWHFKVCTSYVTSPWKIYPGHTLKLNLRYVKQNFWCMWIEGREGGRGVGYISRIINQPQDVCYRLDDIGHFYMPTRYCLLVLLGHFHFLCWVQYVPSYFVAYLEGIGYCGIATHPISWTQVHCQGGGGERGCAAIRNVGRVDSGVWTICAVVFPRPYTTTAIRSCAAVLLQRLVM